MSIGIGYNKLFRMEKKRDCFFLGCKYYGLETIDSQIAVERYGTVVYLQPGETLDIDRDGDISVVMEEEYYQDPVRIVLHNAGFNSNGLIYSSNLVEKLYTYPMMSWEGRMLVFNNLSHKDEVFSSIKCSTFNHLLESSSLFDLHLPSKYMSHGLGDAKEFRGDPKFVRMVREMKCYGLAIFVDVETKREVQRVFVDSLLNRNLSANNLEFILNSLENFYKRNDFQMKPWTQEIKPVERSVYEEFIDFVKKDSERGNGISANAVMNLHTHELPTSLKPSSF